MNTGIIGVSITTVTLVISGALAYQSLRSEVDELNDDMKKQEIVREDVIGVKKDMSYVKESVSEIKMEQREQKQLLNSIYQKVK